MNEEFASIVENMIQCYVMPRPAHLGIHIVRQKVPNASEGSASQNPTNQDSKPMQKRPRYAVVDKP